MASLTTWLFLTLSFSGAQGPLSCRGFWIEPNAVGPSDKALFVEARFNYAVEDLQVGPAGAPYARVILVGGRSDSPYALRAILGRFPVWLIGASVGRGEFLTVRRRWLAGLPPGREDAPYYQIFERLLRDPSAPAQALVSTLKPYRQERVYVVDSFKGEAEIYSPICIRSDWQILTSNFMQIVRSVSIQSEFNKVRRKDARRIDEIISLIRKLQHETDDLPSGKCPPEARTLLVLLKDAQTVSLVKDLLMSRE